MQTPPAAACFCSGHPTAPIVATCTSCSRGLCEACNEYVVDGHTACGACAYLARSSVQRRLGYALTLVGIAGTALWLMRAKLSLPWVLGIAAAALVVAVIVVATASTPREVARRADLLEEPPPTVAGPDTHPYRARAIHVTAKLTPKVSASATVFAVLASLGLAAFALPTALDLPRWLEIEAVVGAWWGVFFVALSVLLYRGYRLRDDYMFVLPWKRPKTPEADAAGSAKKKSGKGSGVLDDVGSDTGCSGVDGEGCLYVIAIVVVLVVFVGAAYVLAELALPLVFVLGYAVILRALGRVARDRHECEGSLLRAAGWGALWSTIYLAPFGAVVVAVHVALSQR